jgi:hypothetical protein
MLETVVFDMIPINADGEITTISSSFAGVQSQPERQLKPWLTSTVFDV